MSMNVSGMKTGSSYLSVTMANEVSSYYSSNKSALEFLGENFFNLDYDIPSGLSSNYQGFGMTYNNYNNTSLSNGVWLQYQASDIPHCSIPTGPELLFSSSCGTSSIAALFNDSNSSLNSLSDIKQQKINYYS